MTKQPVYTLPAELCEPVMLLESDPERAYEDGRLLPGEEVPALAILRECTERDASDFGNVRDAHVIILADSHIPGPTTRIRCRDREYT